MSIDTTSLVCIVCKQPGGETVNPTGDLQESFECDSCKAKCWADVMAWEEVEMQERISGEAYARAYVNITQHLASPEQEAEGVINLDDESRLKLKALLTFDSLPSAKEVEERAEKIVDLVYIYGEKFLIGGAPFLMPALVAAFKEANKEVFFAFSVRESKEETLPDGSVRKTSVFKHKGFIPA